MPTPIHPDSDIQGKRVTLGALAQRVGATMHIKDIGPLHPDGRRRADQAPYTANTGLMAKLLKKSTNMRADQVAKLKEAKALHKQLPDRPDIKAAFEQLVDENNSTLLEAIQNIKVAHADLDVSATDVPWLLAYHKMNQGDEGSE